MFKCLKLYLSIKDFSLLNMLVDIQDYVEDNHNWPQSATFISTLGFPFPLP